MANRFLFKPAQKINSTLALIVVAVLSVALFSACSGAKRRLAADLPSVTNTVNLKPVWTLSIGKSEPYAFKPLAVGDDIYTANAAGKIYRIDAFNGRQTWAVDVGSDLSAGPGSDGRVIAVANTKGMVFAYDANGGKLWQESVGTEVLTEPLVGGGVVVVRTIDNRFIGLDATTGKRRWVYQRGQSPLSLRTSYSMLNINNEVLMAGFSGGKFGILALATGNLIWESTLSSPRGVSEIERLSDIAAKPTLLGSRMCAVAYQGKIGCGEIKSASMSWVKDFSSFNGTTQTADHVFAVNEKSYVVGFKASTGEEIWRNEKLVWRDLSEPLAVGKVIVVGDAQGYLHILSQESGEFLGRIRVDSSPIVTAPISVGGSIVVQTRSGTLSAFRPN